MPIGEIKFTDKKLKNLANKIIKETKDYEKIEKEELIYDVSKRKKYDVNEYKNLKGFVDDIRYVKLSLKEEQSKLWNLIYQTKKNLAKKSLAMVRLKILKILDI